MSEPFMWPVEGSASKPNQPFDSAGEVERVAINLVMGHGGDGWVRDCRPALADIRAYRATCNMRACLDEEHCH